MTTLTTTTDLFAQDPVQQAYALGVGSWSGADWTHRRRVDGINVTTHEGAPVYCDNTKRCDTCSEAGQAAIEAESLAAEAIGLYRDNRVHAAMQLAEQASALERQWGDAPTWGPLEDAIGEMLD